MTNARFEVWKKRISGRNVTSMPKLQSLPPTSEAFAENVKEHITKRVCVNRHWRKIFLTLMSHNTVGLKMNDLNNYVQLLYHLEQVLHQQRFYNWSVAIAELIILVECVVDVLQQAWRVPPSVSVLLLNTASINWHTLQTNLRMTMKNQTNLTSYLY